MIRARRLLLAFSALMVLALLSLMGRLAWLHVGDAGEAAARQARQSSGITVLRARRGVVADRFERPLARSIETLRLSIYPPNVTHLLGEARPLEDVQATVEAITAFLAPRLGLPAAWRATWWASSITRARRWPGSSADSTSCSAARTVSADTARTCAVARCTRPTTSRCPRWTASTCA